MDEELERMRTMLRPDEHIIWSGQPDPDVIFAPQDVFLIPGYLFFEAFGVFWLWLVTRTTPTSGSSVPFGFFDLVGVVFIAIGAYFLIGRFFVKAWDKRRTVYALTNRRALVLKGGTLRESPIVGQSRTTTLSRDGSHVSIQFGEMPTPSIFRRRQYYPNTGMDWIPFAGPFPLGFYDVTDPDDLLRALGSAETSAAA